MEPNILGKVAPSTYSLRLCTSGTIQVLAPAFCTLTLTLAISPLFLHQPLNKYYRDVGHPPPPHLPLHHLLPLITEHLGWTLDPHQTVSST